MHTITPMVVAQGPQREKSRFTYMHNFGEKVDIPYVSWLIEGGNALVLVDTGCSADAYRTRIRGDEPLRLAGETFRDVEDTKTLEEHFAERGLEFDDVDILVQTHLDWDHCMNTSKFRRSQIVIQESEWRKIPYHALFKSTYAPPDAYEEIGRLHVRFVDGDVALTDGIDLVYAPGHSPGGQSVAVETSEGTYVIAGMCTIRENFYPPEEVTSRSAYKVIPTGMHVDPIVCYDSMLRLLEIGGDRVLPFHDGAVKTMGTLGG